MGMIFLLLGDGKLFAQFTPINVTGFNQDAIAEGPPNSLATTTMELDAIGSNKVMYSAAFAGFAGITGGLPNNGTIVSGADSYQLAPYTGNNALFVKRNKNLDLNVASFGQYAQLATFCFFTEGPSTVNVDLSFLGGTTTSYIANYNLPDWFFGATNIVTQGFGRCSRIASGPFTPDGFPTNPRLYYIEITLNCTDIPKILQRITFSNVSTSGNAPFPNAVILAVSGIPYSFAMNPVITPTDCGGSNGSIALNVVGSSPPYSYSWNTTPVQTGSTATGLPTGEYICWITDASSCARFYQDIVPFIKHTAVTVTHHPQIL